MAKSEGSKRRPRVRKSAPTLRERAEAVRASEVSNRPRRARRILSKVASLVKRLRLSERRVIKLLTWPFKLFGKFLRWIIPSYFISSWRELRKVRWPNRKETWRLTLAVFIFAIVFGALVAGVDKVLKEIFKKVILN
mgnify:CR=1 FL=1